MGKRKIYLFKKGINLKMFYSSKRKQRAVREEKLQFNSRGLINTIFFGG